MKEKLRLAVLTAALFFALGSVLEPSVAQNRPAPPRPAPNPTLPQEGPGALRLGELLELARERSPRLKAAHFRVDATRTREEEAGVLPDPTLMIGVANLALPEFSATMPASMAPSFQATQRFPLAGKRSLAEEIARQSTEIDATAAEEVWWTVRTEAARGFYDLYRLDGQAEVLRRTLGLLQDFEAIALSRYAAGTGAQADVLRAGVASMRTEADIERLSALRRGASSMLNALINQPADTPFPSPQLPPLPSDIPSLETLTGWAIESRAALHGLQIAVTRAGSRMELADKAIWPDLTVGLQYALGRMEGDPTSMGGASVGFSVPIHAGSRQKKLREEAAALESMARAQLEDALAAVNANVSQVLAELDRARTLLGLYQEDILPQARAAVESSLSSYRVGALDFMALIDAQMAVNRFEGEYIDLLASYGVAVAQLEQTIGRDLPVTGDFILEIR